MNTKLNTNYLQCVYCGMSTLFVKNELYYCSNDKCNKFESPYYSIKSKPVLINYDLSLVKNEWITSLDANSIVNRTEGKLKIKIRNLFRLENNITKNNISVLNNEISKIFKPRILVIGGGEIGNGFEEFYNKFKSCIISFDIYDSKNIDFIADAHNIPTNNDHFDLIIIQAVLEHVLDPYRVVSEIYRVLKHDGIVYAETPFMQQVHEGPYDFLRFSESGHRYLFKNFSLIKSGFVLGAGTSLLWSIDFFFSGLFRSRFVGKLFRISLFWISLFDKIIPDAYNVDAACGVFFIGKKSKATMTKEDLINHYNGNQ